MFKPYPPAYLREAAETEEIYTKCRCLDPATPKGFSKYRYQLLYKFLLRGETLSDEEWNHIHKYVIRLGLTIAQPYSVVLEDMVTILLMD